MRSAWEMRAIRGAVLRAMPRNKEEEERIVVYFEQIRVKDSNIQSWQL
jgi:hypothetical protein